MPKYVIEREIPGAGSLSAEQLKAISQKSCGVLRNLGPEIQWLESFVTDDKIYCVYIAPDEATVRQHAEQGGFPAPGQADDWQHLAHTFAISEPAETFSLVSPLPARRPNHVAAPNEKLACINTPSATMTIAR